MLETDVAVGLNFTTSTFRTFQRMLGGTFEYLNWPNSLKKIVDAVQVSKSTARKKLLYKLIENILIYDGRITLSKLYPFRYHWNVGRNSKNDISE